MLRGADRLSAKLKGLRRDWERGASETVRETAAAACAEARRLVPVKTGRLQRSLTVIPDGPLRARTAAVERYAAAVELGRVGRPPQPFLGPAAESRRRAFPEAMRRRLKRG